MNHAPAVPVPGYDGSPVANPELRPSITKVMTDAGVSDSLVDKVREDGILKQCDDTHAKTLLHQKESVSKSATKQDTGSSGSKT